MRLGCVAWAVQAPILDAVRAAADAGLQAFSLLEAPQERLSLAELAELDNLMASRDLVATLHTTAVGDDDSERRGVIERRLALAREWHERTGRLACVTFDGAYFRKDEAKIVDLETNAARLDEALGMFAPLGVRVGIENSPRFLHNAEDVDALARLVNPREIGWHLDLGHLNMCLRQYGIDPAGFIRHLPFEIIELHVHDNDGMDDSHIPIGDGNTDFAPIVAALKARRFDGIATLENCGLQSAEEAVDVWRRCEGIFMELW